VNRHIKVWEVESGKELASFDVPNANPRRLAWSKDGTLLATAVEDATVRVWNVKTGAQLKSIEVDTRRMASASRVVFAPDGKWLSIAGHDMLRIWNMTTWIKCWEWEIGSCSWMDYTPDGRFLMFCGFRTMVLDALEPGEPARDKPPLGRLRAEYSGGFDEASFSPDGKRLATTVRGVNTVKIVDLLPLSEKR
jgi:WD40 repeat protein